MSKFYLFELTFAMKLNYNYKSLKWLKSDFHLLKIIVICLIESPLKMMKNAFCFILKSSLVLKISKFLSLLFGHVGKTAWLERWF